MFVSNRRCFTLAICVFLISVSTVGYGGCACIGEAEAGRNRANDRNLNNIVIPDVNSLKNKVNEITVTLNRLIGIPDQLNEVKTNTEQYRAETTKIEQEATATTSRLEESVASASEDLKQQKQELQRQKQEFEDYKIQFQEQDKADRLNKQRQERLYDAFYDIFDQGDIQDPVMIELFAKACEFSPEFKTLLEDLKTVPTIRRLFKQKAHRLEMLFWTIFKEHKDMETLIDQPIQPAISDSDNYLPKLKTESHSGL